MPELIVLTVILAILFDISNGWNDSANAIATVVSTRVLSPLAAVLMAATMNMAGAFFSTAVAKTIGKDMVDPMAVTEIVVISALITGFLWNTVMTRLGLPVSASHALIGSLIGAAIAYGGLEIINIAGTRKIFIALMVSPFIGIMFGYMFMICILRYFGHHSPGSLNRRFGMLQILSSSFMAFGHGSNDAQKVMGIITLSLVSGGYLNTLEVPLWVIVISGLAMALGTAFGGWRVIKTLGVQMLKLEPVHGFAAETAATTVILGASLMGLPVSTTHVITTSIMGVGSTKRLSAVRWGVAGKIIMAWVFTLPVCVFFAWLICKSILFFIA